MSTQMDLIIRPRRYSILQRWADGLRSIYLGPWNPKDREIARMFGGSPSSAGVTVNEQTALNYSAVWAAVNLIAGDISSVPLMLYRREKTGGKTKFDTHPLYRLIHDQPNPQMGSDVFRRTLQAHKLIWGNGYAEIVRDNGNRPVELWPLMPYAVQPFLERGELYYRVTNPDGRQVVLDAMSIIHVRGLSDDGINGIPVITKARESLGLGIAAERFGATFFGNGSTFGGVISYKPGTAPNPQTRKENREAIEKVHQGVDRAHKFLVLYEGAEYQRLGIPPNDAQFLETRQFQIAEVARWFGVPPHKIGDLSRSTYTNIEQQSLDYVGSLRPHFVNWEHELSQKLIFPLEQTQQFIEHSMEGLLRGDAAARGAFYSQLFQIGAITQNEIRSLENLNPVEGGDTPFVPLNSIPSDRLTEYVDALIEAKTAPKSVPEPKPQADQQQQMMEGEMKALREALDEARRCRQLAEDLRDKALVDGQLSQQAYEQEVAAHGATRDEMTAALDLERQAVRALVLSRDVVTVERDQARAEAATFQQAAELSEQKAKDAEARAIQSEKDADEAKGLALEASHGKDEASQALAAVTTERDAIKAAAGTREAELTAALEQARDAFTSERGAHDLTDADRKDSRAQIETLTAEAETLRTDLARARADIATELEKQRTQKTVMLAAMRSLFVDASERLLYREAERARHNQQTPDKLRTWVERFYPMHESHVRETFRPLVGPWTAITGGPPNVLLDKLVAEHLETSRSALLNVADSLEPDEMAASLERTLTRWEHERADGMADALVREGMNGDG